jgi:hypothetical protein
MTIPTRRPFIKILPAPVSRDCNICNGPRSIRSPRPTLCANRLILYETFRPRFPVSAITKIPKHPKNAPISKSDFVDIGYICGW